MKTATVNIDERMWTSEGQLTTSEENRLIRTRPHGSNSFREVFRYAKATRVRIYNLNVLSDETSELWVASEEKGRSVKSRKLVTFDNRVDVAPFLQDIERELRAGGWSRLSGESPF